MNNTAPSEISPEIPGHRMAARLGAALLLALGISLVLVLRDNAHRSIIETISESSAVGDTHYAQIPDPLPPEPFPPVAHLEGKELIPSGYKRHEKREAEMQPVAKDPATGLTIYQAPVKAKDTAEPPTYFLKVGPGEFIKARVADKKDE
jgi:hypothetical protein